MQNNNSSTTGGMLWTCRLHIESHSSMLEQQRIFVSTNKSNNCHYFGRPVELKCVWQLQSSFSVSLEETIAAEGVREHLHIV